MWWVALLCKLQHGVFGTWHRRPKVNVLLLLLLLQAPLPPGAAGADGQKSNASGPTSMDVDVNDVVNDDWAALTKGDDAAAAAPAAAAAADPAAAAADPAAAAVEAKQEPGSSSGAAGEAAAAAAGSGEAAAGAAAGVKQEPAAAAAAAGDGAAAAAAGGGGEDMWDEFAEKAKQEEEKLQKQREEEEQVNGALHLVWLSFHVYSRLLCFHCRLVVQSRSSEKRRSGCGASALFDSLHMYLGLLWYFIVAWSWEEKLQKQGAGAALGCLGAGFICIQAAVALRLSTRV
jgi:hypothetical protein